MAGDPAYPVEYFVQHAEEVFGIPPEAVSGALSGHGGALTIGEAQRLLIQYLGTIVEATPPPGVRRYTAVLGDGAAKTFDVPHNLGVKGPAVTVYDLSQTPPAVVDIEVQQGGDTNHIVLSATAWDAEAPTAASLEVVVIA